MRSPFLHHSGRYWRNLGLFSLLSICTTSEDLPSPQTFGDWLYVPFDFVFYQMLPWRTGVAHPVSVQTAIAQIAPRPILIISGGAEQNMMQHHFVAAREPKTLWVIPEAAHIEGLYVRPQEYEEKVVAFFDEALLP